MRYPLVGVALLVTLGFALAGSANEENVKLDDIPSVVKDAIRKKYPTAELVSATKEKDEDEDEDIFEVLVKVNGQQIDITLDDEGEIEGLEKTISAADLPEAVKATVKKEAPAGEIQKVEAVYEVDDGEEDLEYYEVAIKNAKGEESELRIEADGSLVEDEEEDEVAFTEDFSSDKANLVSSGKSPFFVLEPGHQTSYESGEEKLVITVLNETRLVDGVETRVVEERETKGAQTIEVSRNFFAISKQTSNVYYFGEEVDMYKDGKIANHEGSWESGKNGAKFGLAMPGLPLLGARYQQEVAPKMAMDQGTVISVSETVTVPAGTFSHCVKIEETTPLEPGVKEYKTYAPGVGLVVDGDQKLVKVGSAGNK